MRCFQNWDRAKRDSRTYVSVGVSDEHFEHTKRFKKWPNFLAVSLCHCLPHSCLFPKAINRNWTEYADVVCCTGRGEFAKSPSPPRKSAVSPSPTAAATKTALLWTRQTDAGAGSELAAAAGASGQADTKQRGRRPLYSRKCRPTDRPSDRTSAEAESFL